MSSVWILMGLVLNGMIIGHISSQLSVANSEEPVEMYNVKVRAINDSFEYRYAVRKNGQVQGVLTILEILEGVQSSEVKYGVVDVLSLVPYKRKMDEMNIKVMALEKIN